MSAQEILDIIQSFFNAILKILDTLGISFKKTDDATAEDTEPAAEA